MSKVVSIGGTSLPDRGQPDPDVLEAAEELLSMVKDGMITGVVIMAQRCDGIYRAYEAGPFDIEHMIGHMVRQQYRLTALSERIDGDD